MSMAQRLGLEEQTTTAGVFSWANMGQQVSQRIFPVPLPLQFNTIWLYMEVS